MIKQAQVNNGAPDFNIPDLAPELLRGPNWLRNIRNLSRDVFNTTPVPRRGLQLWRYTDPSGFLIDRNRILDTSYGDNFEAVEQIVQEHLNEGNLSGIATDLAGRKIDFFGIDDLVAQGVTISRLSDAIEQQPELLERYLYQLINSNTGKFEAMNCALWNDGIFINVPNGVTVKQPLHLLRESGLGGSVQYPRLLVVVGKNAQLTLIDEYGGGSTDREQTSSYANGAVEIFGLEDSRTNYVFVQRQASGMNSYLTHRARIEQGAQMLTIPLAFGGSIAKQNFGVILNGRGAESNMQGLLFGSGHQQGDNHTLHMHAAGDTNSSINFKVVLRDRARSAYTGLIRIEKDARNCDAYQENRNLLLNKNARARTIPELEILNEDVRCSHGATIGSIDPLSLFYLQSRGINLSEAVKILVSGFVATTLSNLPENLRVRISDFVTQRLEQE